MFNRGKKDDHKKGNKHSKDRIVPIEVRVDDPGSIDSIERALKKLNRIIKKEGVFKEVMWRRHFRKKRERKPKYFT